jgi:lysophospholipase L1-like esterase
MERQLFEYHPCYGYRFIPGLKVRVDHEGGGYLLKANQAGFRCEHQIQATKAPGSFRVLLFGDSFTAGDGVSNKQRYGDVLEHLVPGLEVYNFGLSGSGTDQQYLIFQEHAHAIEHDVVLIAVLVENIRRVAARYRQFDSTDGVRLVMAKPYFSLDDRGALELHHQPVPRDPVPETEIEDREQVDWGGRFEWARSAVNRLGPVVKDLAQRVTRYQPLPHYDSPADPSWQLMRGILLRWIGESAKPVVLCPLPLYQHVEGTASPDGYRARFRELAAESGATLHDPLDDFLRYSTAERRAFRFATDVHFTPSAHRAMAESLAVTIRALMPVSEPAP